MRKLNHLTFITLWANSADNKLVIFFSYFSQKTGFDIAYIETICMKCQMFSGKNKKNISKCCLLKILPRLLSIKDDLSWRKQLVNLYNDKDTSLALVHDFQPVFFRHNTRQSNGLFPFHLFPFCLFVFYLLF